jgi:PRC-barrel domain protein
MRRRRSEVKLLPLTVRLQAIHHSHVSARLGADGREWLSHCEGFTVYDTHGRVGKVEDVIFREWGDQPNSLAVRVGLLRRHIAIVPTAAVEAVDIARRRIDLGNQDTRG